MLNIKYIGSLLCILALAGCAEEAAHIEPSAISISQYDGWNCTKLNKEKTFIEQALTRQSAVQDEAARKDFWNVFWFGIPLSNGGIPSEIARLKGENEAIRKYMLERGCI